MTAEAHCSKCCPVEPPEKEKPGKLPSAALVWLAAVSVAVVGGWALLMWSAARAFA